MTVSELIERLGRHDPSALVVVYDDDLDIRQAAEEITVCRRKNSKNVTQACVVIGRHYWSD